LPYINPPFIIKPTDGLIIYNTRLFVNTIFTHGLEITIPFLCFL